MKTCPNCNQTFTDDNVFCPNDGTTLFTVSSAGSDPPVFPTAGETPTQVVVTRPMTVAQPAASNDSSKWLFLVIGVLATALAGSAIFMFAMRGDDKKEAANQNSKTNENTNQTENVLAKNTQQNFPNANTSAPKPVNPNLSPTGNWSGDWSSNTARFTAVVTLQSAGDDKFSGEILWTFRSSTNPKKAGKEGMTATEYVRGNFDPSTRTLLLNGYQTEDPNGLGIIKDKYKLVLSENNEQLNGFSFGGKTRGKVTLRR